MHSHRITWYRRSRQLMWWPILTKLHTLADHLSRRYLLIFHCSYFSCDYFLGLSWFRQWQLWTLMTHLEGSTSTTAWHLRQPTTPTSHSGTTKVRKLVGAEAASPAQTGYWSSMSKYSYYLRPQLNHLKLTSTKICVKYASILHFADVFQHMKLLRLSICLILLVSWQASRLVGLGTSV